MSNFCNRMRCQNRVFAFIIKFIWYTSHAQTILCDLYLKMKHENWGNTTIFGWAATPEEPSLPPPLEDRIHFYIIKTDWMLHTKLDTTLDWSIKTFWS